MSEDIIDDSFMDSLDDDFATSLEEAFIGESIIGTQQMVYHLSDFDGPLDLLLTLIKAAKINIDDIFISDITGQYVEVLANTPKEELDFEYAGEFIRMAADLVYFKSTHLLPKDDEPIDEDDPEFEKQQLINKIKEYAIIKEETEKLKQLETINRFCRSPQYTDKDFRVALVNFSLPKLVAAFAQVLANAEIKTQSAIPKKVIRDRFSVHDRMQFTLDYVLAKCGEEVLFTDLIDDDYSPEDIVTTFLALLELLKYGKLTVSQEEVYGDIKIFLAEGVDSNNLEFEEGDDGKY